MYSETDIASAVEAGILPREAADALRQHVTALRSAPQADEEHFRLITGFNDIFVAIAGVLVLVGAAWMGAAASVALGAALVAAAAWGLAEYFTRVRRMALPSIIFLLAFAGGVLVTFVAIFTGDGSIDADDRTGAILLAVSAAITAGATWLHWRRFQVPITVAAGVAACVGIVLALVAAAFPSPEKWMLFLVLLAGLVVFLIAMRWDASDRERKTRRSDVAFWLHLLSAPMIVHPVFVLLGITDGQNEPWKVGIVLAIYVVLAAVALIVDRRALMVSGLAYVLAALIELFQDFGAVSLNVALAAFVIGSALLLLSAFWSHARHLLLERLPDKLRSRLPDAGLPMGVSLQPAS